MAYAAHDTDPTTGDDPAAAVAIFKGNDEAIAAHHLAASAPVTGLANGWVWLDSTSSTLYVLNIRQNGAWVTVFSCTATALTLVKDLDFNGNEAVGLLLEKLATGSLSTTEGRLQWDTTLDLVAWGDGTNKLYAAQCLADATTYRRIRCALSTTNQGTPATTPVTSTFLDDGFQLDAAAEGLTVRALEPVPTGWTTANDLFLEADCYLLNTETAGDTIDLGLSWATVSNGEALSTTPTAATNAATVVASATQYTRTRVSITIDHDAVGNTVAVGDTIIGTISHDPTAGANPVAGIIILDAWLKVPVFNFDA